jgi:hypothetical protein
MRLSHVLAPLLMGACAPSPPTVGPDARRLPLELLPDTLAYCRVPADAPLPEWAGATGHLTLVARSPSEVSVLGVARTIPLAADCHHRDFLVLRLDPNIPDLVGTVATVTRSLAAVGVSVYVVTTTETDYYLVHAPDVSRALKALREAGHPVTVAGQ